MQVKSITILNDYDTSLTFTSVLVARLSLTFCNAWTLTHQASLSMEFSSKNTGVGCHFLLQCMKMKSESEVAQSCPTLSDPMDCSPPGSSVHGIFQARVLEWGAIAFSGLVVYQYLKQLMIVPFSRSRKSALPTAFANSLTGNPILRCSGPKLRSSLTFLSCHNLHLVHQ